MESFVSPEEKFPFVSVILTVKNEERTINALIESVLNLDYPNYEVILVDTGSSDETVHIAKKHRIKIVQTETSVPSKGRNVGIHSSSGEMVAFVDGDCRIIEKNWLREGVLLLQQEGVGGVGGPVLSCDNGTYLSRALWDVFSTFFASGGSTLTARHKDQKEVKNLPSGNVIYRREAIEKVGLFNENLRFCEDIDLSHRVRKAGYRLLFSPLMAVEHNWKVQSFGSMFWHMLRYGSGRANASRKCSHLFSPFYTIPSIALIGLLSISLLSFFYRGLFMPVTVSLISMYVTVAFISAFLAAYQFKDMRMILVAPATYVILHLGYSIGFILGLIVGDR